MELYQEMVRGIKIELPDMNVEKILELHCYQALAEIKNVLADPTLDDPECFYRIEEIVCIFERLGSTGGGRHDFG